ncbi:MAG: methionine-R-sulfoxide reductase [Candidatus Berkelbacteria bacterium]
MNQNWKKLTPEQQAVIVDKATEPPFFGKYDDFYKEGFYACARCGNPLYDWTAKFDAGCGWPAFDRNYPDAVKRIADSDGVRTEIVCANCDAHLGHVFEGEKLTPTDTRHCVNSLSIEFVPKEKI